MSKSRKVTIEDFKAEIGKKLLASITPDSDGLLSQWASRMLARIAVSDLTKDERAELIGILGKYM